MNTPPLLCVPGLLALAALAAFPSQARAQVFISHANPLSSGTTAVSEYSSTGTLLDPTFTTDGDEDVAVSGSFLYTLDQDGTIGKYTLAGTPVATTLATASSGTYGFAIAGPDIFVSNLNLGTVEEYTTSGATVTKTLITGLTNVYDIDVSGSDLFVENSGVISEYTTSGVLVNANLITGILGSVVVVDGTNLYVDDAGGISKYTTSGGLVKADFISVPFVAGDLAVDGSDLLVGNGSTGTIAEYTLSGTLVNPSFASGLDLDTGIAVVSNVPDGPWNAAPLFGAAALALALVRRRRGRLRRRPPYSGLPALGRPLGQPDPEFADLGRGAQGEKLVARLEDLVGARIKDPRRVALDPGDLHPVVLGGRDVARVRPAAALQSGTVSDSIRTSSNRESVSRWPETVARKRWPAWTCSIVPTRRTLSRG